MTFLMYIMYSQNYRMANIAYNLLIDNIREENAPQKCPKSQPRHISACVEEWKKSFDNSSF